VIYLDEAKDVQSKGVHSEFGWYINRPFYIVSRMAMNRVIEAHGNNWLYLRRYVKNRKAQTWVFNGVDKTLHNGNWKNYAMTIHSNGNSNHMRMLSSITSRWWQMFRLQGAYVVNEKGKVLDVQNHDDVEGRHIFIENKANNRMSQQWDIIYADEYPEEPKKGELNIKFGLYVERPFYIVSEMPSNRYLDIINNRNMVIKTRNGRNTQTWYFHQQSLTIRTKLNNQSWDIHGSGKNQNMQIWSTNSNWW
jgi:hypothetical protein